MQFGRKIESFEKKGITVPRWTKAFFHPLTELGEIEKMRLLGCHRKYWTRIFAKFDLSHFIRS